MVLIIISYLLVLILGMSIGIPVFVFLMNRALNAPGYQEENIRTLEKLNELIDEKRAG